MYLPLGLEISYQMIIFIVANYQKKRLMKNKNSIIAFIALLTFTTLSIAQAPQKEKVYTLQSGESLVYGENCFYLTDQGKDIFIVTRIDDNFFIVDNGVRKGPFSNLNDDMLKPCKHPSSSCAVYDPEYDESENVYDKYVTANDDGSGVIKFNAKSYGPYLAIFQFEVSSDKSRFVAVVKDMNNKNIFISSFGKTFAIDGLPNSIKFSPDGSLAILRVGFDYSSPDFDPTSMSMDKLMEINFITSNGEKVGPFNGEKVGDSNIWFSRTTGNHWFIEDGEQLYLDGKPFMKRPESGVKCEIWFSHDCKRYAVSSYEKIQFSDGTFIPFPIHISPFMKDGKAYLKCVTFENEKEINVYTKAL